MPLIPLKVTVNPTSSGNSWTPTGKSVSVSCGITAPSSWFLAHIRFCLCPPSVCFPSPVEVLQSNPAGLQNQIPWGFSVPLLDPQVGESFVAPGTLQQCKNFFGIIVLQFVGHLLGCSMVELMATSSKSTDAIPRASQVCCSPLYTWQATAHPCLD